MAHKRSRDSGGLVHTLPHQSATQWPCRPATRNCRHPSVSEHWVIAGCGRDTLGCVSFFLCFILSFKGLSLFCHSKACLYSVIQRPVFTTPEGRGKTRQGKEGTNRGSKEHSRHLGVWVRHPRLTRVQCGDRRLIDAHLEQQPVRDSPAAVAQAPGRCGRAGDCLRAACEVATGGSSLTQGIATCG